MLTDSIITTAYQNALEKLKGLLSEDLDFHDQDSRYAFHNFHAFPAKFPPQLPRKFIQSLTLPGETVLDPMMGSGTTILEAFLAGMGNSKIRGQDVNIPECLIEIGELLGFIVPRVGVRRLDRNRRMMPVGANIDIYSQIQQRMHQEYIIGFYKPLEANIP
ncbi:MAG: DNA methyltransferase [Roseiflexus sp.]